MKHVTAVQVLHSEGDLTGRSKKRAGGNTLVPPGAFPKHLSLVDRLLQGALLTTAVGRS